MAELRLALDGALTDQSQLVMLVGEPGIGKTRTAQETTSYAVASGFRTLWGRCHEGEGAPPYWPWVQPIRSYVQSTGPDQLALIMGAGAADIAEIVSELGAALTYLKPPPELMAGMWLGGRETILVSDRLDRTSKEAMSATLSQVNDCSYCADMLISLMHSSGEHQVASGIFANDEKQITDLVMQERCTWIRAVATAGPEAPPKPPFTAEELPEAIGSLFVFSYINRFSHVVMDGSPVAAPFGLPTVKNAALRMFGFNLRPTTARALEPGLALDLLPPAPLPDDFGWAAPNPRVADALARWAAVIERETPEAISPAVRELVEGSLQQWQGELMPLSRSWVEDEAPGLTGEDRAVARLALVVAKASYQFDESLAQGVLGCDQDEERLIRVLAWASHSGARRFANGYYKYFLAEPDQPRMAGAACNGHCPSGKTEHRRFARGKSQRRRQMVSTVIPQEQTGNMENQWVAIVGELGPDFASRAAKHDPKALLWRRTTS